jgi:hypothetical protein
MSLSPDGGRMALSYRHKADVCETATGAVVRTITPPESSATHLWFAPDGRMLLISCAEEMEAPETLFTLGDPDGDAPPLRASVDWQGHKFTLRTAFRGSAGERLYLCGGFGVFRWLPPTGEFTPLIQQKTGITGFAVRDDEKFAVTLGGNTAQVWSLPDGSRQLEVKHLQVVSGAAFLPGDRLLTSCDDG